MANAVARPRVDDPEPGANAFQVKVVVRVLEADLERVVVYVIDGEGSADAVRPERLELQIGHGAGRVLREGLIDCYAYGVAGHICAVSQMCLKYFLYDVLAHISLAFRPPILPYDRRRNKGASGRDGRADKRNSGVYCGEGPYIFRLS